MKSDVRLINLENLDINSLKLPDEKFDCYVICNHTIPDKELLLKLIQGEVKDINVCGKYAGIWEKGSDDICVEYENNGQKPSDWLVTTEESNLDSFINFLAFAHCEYYDDEVLSHNPILLFYDDENLKNYVLKRVEWLLEDTSTPDPHENDEDYDYSKDFALKERVELDCHTNKNKGACIIEPSKAVWGAFSSGLAGIAICDHYSVQAYADAYKEAKRKNKYLRVLYGVHINGAFVNNINVIAKNQEGKKAIYKYLTHYFTSEDNKITYEKNGINWTTTELQKIIDDNRENLLIGLSAYYNSTAMAEAMMMGKEADINLIREDIADCDYVEVAPICTYKKYNSRISDEEIKNAIRLIIDVAKEENKLIVATSAPRYVNNSDYLAYSILYEHNSQMKLPDGYDGHIYTTEEMRYAMDWLEDDDLVEEIVVTNTHKIMDMCEDFELVDETYHAPSDEFGNYKELVARTVIRLHDIYGPNVDPLIKARYDDELRIIRETKTASIYMLSTGIVDEAKFEGYITGTRGSIGATFTGFLLGLTKCNPLPPHYVCPKCHKAVWNATVADGFDAEPKMCSECGTPMKSDGHNIPYETFMGRNGERLPDIDLNVAPQFREKIVDVIKKVAPNNEVYRAGTIFGTSYKNAKKMVDEFAGEGEEVLDFDTKERLIEKIQSVAQSQGLHPGGEIIVPNGVDINDYTPLDKVDDVICTHNEYHNISDYFYKADILSHADPECFKFFKDNGLNYDEIDILDPKVMELFNPDNELEYDYAGIPEFGYGGNGKASEIIELVRPKKFSDLVKISALMHGTNTWNNNGKVLFEQGISLEELLGSRDDVFNTLIKYGIDRDMAYSIMEAVRKGKGIETDVGDYLLKCNLPSWFVKSCNTIKYMFPKAHAIEYVINELMLAWVKIYKPALFYASYFNFRTNTFELDTMCKSFEEIDERLMKLDEDGKGNSNLVDTLYIAGEMARRGIKLINKNAKDIDTNIIFEINPKNNKEIIVSSPTI